jgi:hypothetical protein
LAVAKALGVRRESRKTSWTIATGADRFASPLRFKPPPAALLIELVQHAVPLWPMPALDPGDTFDRQPRSEMQKLSSVGSFIALPPVNAARRWKR